MFLGIFLLAPLLAALGIGFVIMAIKLFGPAALGVLLWALFAFAFTNFLVGP